MLKLLVIADDFTGALDTGVQFSNQGIKTLVSTDTNLDYRDVDEDVEVLVMNTESRYLSFEMAYQQIKAIIVSAQKVKIPHIYKKVDSALRGNISAEIKAVQDVSQQTVIPFLPAYPEMNRVLIDGNLYIDQVLVTESVFADDPYEPVTESNVLRRLKQEAQIEAQLIQGNTIPSDAHGLLVFDAETDDTLIQQLEALEQANLLGMSIGCAGFAKVLAKQLFPNERPISYSLKDPLVVICGSVNPITKKQIEHAENKQFPRISLTPQQLLRTGYWESSDGQKDLNRYLTLMEKHPLLIFETLNEETTKGITAYSKENNLPSTEYRFRIGQSLGILTQALWSKHSENTFLFTGGDTLFQSMKVLGVNTIEPIAEISPGVVLSTIEWKQKKRQVITKSGGFGNEELFEEISQLNTK
ncbi:four-carbon acid sugar kinase family protein [Enterococcus sp. 669A]|uniref:Four-carbon acid sugar kinase family protein n=1 Tax=Candidatus Enterococcus moelleringii TaxID=2815325 RepID=A0ABS3L7U9_9ENTE|nr:four-carbon acid sugar kinase family protein [Enterococcus sp. 669A]MBO1305698.1 four-carbon acid sugar kinase family protein [Enterococcus sp. 669A]